MNEQLQIIEVLISKGEVKKAEVAIAKVLRNEIAPQERAQALIYRARVRLLFARPADALDDLATVETINLMEYQSAPVQELRAECYLARFELASVGFAQRADAESARQIYNRLIAEYPVYGNIGWVYYQLGRISVISNQIDLSLEWFQKALLSPSHVKPLTAYCYERMGFVSYFEKRDLPTALSLLGRAVDTYPSGEDRRWLAQVHILRSRVLKGMHEFDAALKAAETALEVVTKLPNENAVLLSEISLTTAELLSEMGQRDREVISLLQQFMQNSRKPLGVDVTWSRVYEMIGNAHFNLGSYDNAIQMFLSALQLNPDHPWALTLYYRIARSYYQRQNYNDVVHTIESMVSLAHSDGHQLNDYSVFDILGSAFFALAKYDQATEAYQKALELAPANAENINKIRSYYDMAKKLATTSSR